METGEFGFEDIFNLGLSPEESSELRIPFFYSGIIMWIIFLVAIPILLNNMLVSHYNYGDYFFDARKNSKGPNGQSLLGHNYGATKGIHY